MYRCTLLHLTATLYVLVRFVFCRQRQDEKLRRGGEQTAVVVLSEQPFSSALVSLSQMTGPLYFSEGAAALSQVSNSTCISVMPVQQAILVVCTGCTSHLYTTRKMPLVKGVSVQ